MSSVYDFDYLVPVAFCFAERDTTGTQEEIGPCSFLLRHITYVCGVAERDATGMQQEICPCSSPFLSTG